ncbi:cation-translocating P-type ATPase [Salinispirillum marinum]|uniref:Cation-translocating P-type ATPase n=2 Tax=Saccharospirillaceae TaxID=255527 RepID=A0ABV8BA09_9GAMM
MSLPLPQALWHHLAEEDVLAEVRSHHHRGLSTEDVAERQRLFGFNRISTQKTTSAIKRFLLQLHNPLIYILLLSTAVTFLLREYIDSVVIFSVVLVNAMIGYLQESKAEQALNSLRQMLSANAVVVRNGKKHTVPADELVPGDIVLLASGDKVPADVRLIENRNLQVDESALTGESVAVQKQRVSLAKDTVLADRINMAFASTLVTYGQATGVVIATGDQTETGKIARLINNAVTLETPLTKKIQAFSKILLWVILTLAALTFAVGLARGQYWVDTFIAAVALSVAAIPEGLPAVVTITLAIGVRRMARRHAIVRKLPAVETLGSTTIICSDKTGTLTENQMTVQYLYAGGQTYRVSGSGYQPEGDIRDADGKVVKPLPEALQALLSGGVLCNDSQWTQHEGIWDIQGDPTEGAMLVAAVKGGLSLQDCVQRMPRVDVLPFESDQQYMATRHLDVESKDEHRVVFKGSVERILQRCTQAMAPDGITQPLSADQVLAQVEALATQGLRVLAVAHARIAADAPTLVDLMATDTLPDLTFVGLQAMIDPPRAEAIRAVHACQQAGIQVKMITGDHTLTAKAIAEQMGIARHSYVQADVQEHRVLTGQQLSALSDHELLQEVEQVAVFARVAPEQKLKLVTALQAKRHVVAMTGDGVNDAPALKQADIGIAMGKGGTEVAKEAAAMVLTDDNFATIAGAVEEGRNVFDNLVKFITWVLPTNLGQGFVIMVAILLGTALPVLPVQALWLNTTAAVFLGLMLAFEPKETGLMARAPRSPDAPLLTWEMILRVVSVSTWLLLGAFGLFQWALAQGETEAVARTLAVTLFVVVQSVFLLNCRSLRGSVFHLPWLSNPWIWYGIAAMMLAQLAFVYTPIMNLLFYSAPISLAHWVMMLVYGVLVLLLVEAEKWLWRRFAQS